MSPEFFGVLSGALVIVSAIPYSIRTLQGKIEIHIGSWGLWTLLGLALLVTYQSAGAKENVWPAVFGFTNPLLIVLITLVRTYRRKPVGDDIPSTHRLTRMLREIWAGLQMSDRACLAFGLAAFALWTVVRDDTHLAQYALYVAIVADACASIPTIVMLWKDPRLDRPFAWGLFSIGYGLSLFAVSDPTPSNYILPIYMTAGTLLITTPLVVYRIRTRARLLDWI